MSLWRVICWLSGYHQLRPRFAPTPEDGLEMIESKEFWRCMVCGFHTAGTGAQVRVSVRLTFDGPITFGPGEEASAK